MIKLLCSIFKLLLNLYPARFQHQFGTDMLLTLQDGINDVKQKRGFLGLIQFTVFTIVDLLVEVSREHLSEMRVARRATFAFAASCSLLLIWIDVHATESQSPLLVILATCFMLGSIEPKHAWRWGVAIGSVVPLYDLTLSLFRFKPFEVGLFGEFATIVPGVFAAGCGALVRYVVGLANSQKGWTAVLALFALSGGVTIGFADFTLNTPIHAVVGTMLCGAVLGFFSQKPIWPAAILGFGVPLGITFFMAMHAHPSRHHFVFLDARAIAVSVISAMIAGQLQQVGRNQARALDGPTF